MSGAQIKEIGRINIDADKFNLDKLGNFYFITNNVLEKMDKSITLLYSYDNNTFGSISMTDVSDPLRILVFYKDFNRIVYLDKNLAELRDPVLLDDLDYLSVDVVASSQQGGFWIYDNQNSRVVCFDNNLNVVQEGMDLYSVINGAEITDLQISTDYIVLKSSESLLVLDKFANFYTKIAIGQNALFVLDNNKVYLIESDELSFIDLDTKSSYTKVLGLDYIKDFKVSGNKLYILAENSLITFQIL